MDAQAVIKIIVTKGVQNVNLSMFSDSERKAILQEAAETFMRQGKTTEVLQILEHVDLKRYADMLRPIAEQCVELGDYKKAALVYEKIGYHELSEFIRVNFVE